MRAHEVEAWALRVIDDVLAGKPNEDSRVELKKEWPDAKKAARGIAGHANASRGASILWLIGVDEKGKDVVGAGKKELADWFPQVASCFDGVAPDLFDYNIPYGEQVVVALLFETERLPFVIKNPDGGQISREVPWREGTKTISITRENLIKILSPAQQYPSFDILRAELSIEVKRDKNWQGILRLGLYAETTSTNRVTIPFHKCELAVFIDTREVSVYGLEISLKPASTTNETLRSQTIMATNHDISLTGSGYVFLDGSFQCAREWLESFDDDVPDLSLYLTLWPIHALFPVPIRYTFTDGVYTGRAFVWEKLKDRNVSSGQLIARAI